MDQEAGMDRISKLPEQILHTIMSLLPLQDMMRTAALSKTWHRTLASFQIHEFKQQDLEILLFWRRHDRIGADSLEEKIKFGGSPIDSWITKHDPSGENRLEALRQFVNFVDKSLLRQCLHWKRIPKFELYCHRELQLLDHVDGWIRKAIDHHVNELKLQVSGSIFDHWEVKKRSLQCHAWNRMLFSVKELTSLALRSWCFDLSVTACTMNWPSLRKLSLSGIHLEDQFLQTLASRCPLLEDFSLVACEGLRNLQLSGFTRLHNVLVYHCPCAYIDGVILSTISITAPSLVSFRYDRWEAPIPRIDVDSWTKLEVLALHSDSITSQSCEYLISKLPALKDLTLTMPLPKKFTLSSQGLESLVLVLRDPKVLEGTTFDIDTPNLKIIKISYEYLEIFGCCRFTCLFPTFINWAHRSSVQEFHYSITHVSLNAHAFLKMRQHLTSFNQISFLKLRLINLNYADFVLEDLEGTLIPALPDIKHLQLELPPVKERLKSFINGIFWTCHPQTLSIDVRFLDAFRRIPWVKFLCEELINREVKYCTCKSTGIRCWRHDLRIIQIDLSGGAKFPTCESFLESLPTLKSIRIIYIRLEW